MIINYKRAYSYIKILIFAFCLIMPIHYLSFSILLQDFFVFKFWKELIIVAISFLMLYINVNLYKQRKKNTKKPTLIFTLVFTFFIVAFLYWIITPYKVAALDILRVYLFPLILFLVIIQIPFDKEELYFGYKYIAIESCIISVYALFQSFVLGPNFLINLGYPTRPNGLLSYSFYLSGFDNFQRPIGTFVSSNVFGFYMALIFLISLYIFIHKKYINKKIVLFTLICTALSIFFSFSRSVWIGVTFSSIFMLLRFYKKSVMKVDLKKIFILILIIFVLFFIFVFMIGLLTKQNYIQFIFEFFYNSISLEDTSAVSHISSYIKSINVFLENICGTGLGINGAKAAKYFNDFYWSECSYFLILFEFGIVGFISYFSIYLYLFFKAYKNDLMYGTDLLLFVCICYLFLAYIQDLEIVSLLFIYLAIPLSKYLFMQNDSNILFLHSSAELYGSDKSLYNLTTNLYDKEEIGNIFVILPVDGPLVDKLKNKNIENVSIHDIGVLRRKNFNFIGLIKYGIEYISSTLYLMFFIEKNNINIVYTNTSVVMSGGIAAKLVNARTIWHIRETLDKNSLINRIIIGYITMFSNKIIANSKSTLASFNIFGHPNSSVVYNAVEPIKKNVNVKKNNGNDYIIGMAGRINSWKGQEIFIEAAALLKEKIPEKKFNFLIAGDAYLGDEHLIQKLKEMINTLNLNDDVVLMGQINDMSLFYNSLDIFVLPSTKPEPFGLVVIEAMSAGLPVVASNHGGPVEIIEDKEDGLLFANKSPDDLSDKIKELLDDKILFDKISVNAARKQRNKFSVISYSNAIYSIIKGVK